MTVNTYAVNTEPVNGLLGYNFGSFEGPVITLKQRVGYNADTEALKAITLKQRVYLRSHFSGTAITLKQRVTSNYTGAAVLFKQKVTDPSIKTFYDKYLFDVEAIIGKMHITTSLKKHENGFCGELSITGTVGQARSATFTIIPPETIVDIEYFQGQEVIINIKDADGWKPVFTGFVDVPIINLLERKITFQCTDRRNDRIIALGRVVVDTIGYYSNIVFGASSDLADELDKRLKTIPYDFDFDNYGNYQLTAWQPKTTPDYIMDNNKVAYKDVNVEPTNRSKTINRININVTYNYQRLHQRPVTFVWPGYSEFFPDYWNQGRPSFPTKEMIDAAARDTDWKVVSPNGVNFVEVWPAQGFSGNGFDSGAVVWQPNLVEKEYKGRTRFVGYLKDPVTGIFITAGNPAKLFPVYEPVLDVNGNQVMDVVKETITDTSSFLCRGATWTSALRFAQNIQESYNLSLYAPQSSSKFGFIDSFETYNITDDYDTSSWEGSDTITVTVNPFYINKKLSYDTLNQTIYTALNKAKTELLKLHRDFVVSFKTPRPSPKIDLKHTIQLDIDESSHNSTAYLLVKSKVGSFTHYIDFIEGDAYTQVSLYVSRAQGSSTNTAFNINRPIENPNYIISNEVITLGTHLGLNPDPQVTAGADQWDGYVGNREIFIDGGAGSNRTQYNEAFIVNFPAIPETLRGQITYTSTGNYTINIPNDTLSAGF